MIPEPCLFCEEIEEYNGNDGSVDYVCSRCVQLFLNAKPDDLQRAYQKAIDNELYRKATALKMLIGEKDNDTGNQTKPKRKRSNDRRRGTQSVRSQKGAVRRIKEPKKSTLSKIRAKRPAVSRK